MFVRYNLLLFLTTLLFTSHSFAQVTVDQTMTPEQLVQEVLLGTGITAWNITFNGNPGNQLNNQIGRYTGPSNFVDFDDGIVMASGNVIQLEGGFGPGVNPNITGDPDLLVIANPFSVNNCAILEFDFIPTGDSLEIRFVFMSQEYPSFTCSSYNDPFGFFISGPGIDGGGMFLNNAMNIALIPNSDTFIGVNTINSGIPANNANCLSANPNYMEDSQYFVANNPMTPGDVQFPGMTVTITAYAEVICGETYHIKLGIADASDTALDSGVIIEAASFQSNLYIDAALDIPVGVNDSTLYDGCGFAYLTFTRPGDTTLLETVYLEYAGDAINGVHYPLLPDSLVFEPGVSSITFELFVPPGADITGPLQAIIMITNIASECSGDVLTSEFDFWVNTVSPLDAIFNDVDLPACGDSIVIGPIPIDGYGIYTFDWNTGDTDPTLTLFPEETITYTITVGDTCGMEPVTGDITVTVPIAPPVFVNAGEDQFINSCLESVTILGEISGGDENYSYEWYNGGELISEDLGFQYSAPGTSTIVFIGSDACGNTDTDSLTVFVPPVDIFVDAGPDFTLETCYDSVLVQADGWGGVIAPNDWTVTVQSASWGDGTTWSLVDALGNIVLSGGTYGNGYNDTQTISSPAEPLTFNINSTWGDNIPNYTISCNGLVLSGTLPGNSNSSFPGLECNLGGASELSYEWSIPGVGIISDEQDTWVSTLEETYVYVTVSDVCNNTAVDSMLLSVAQIDLFVDAGPPLVLEHCFDSVLVQATIEGGVPGDVTYNWWAATTGGLGSSTNNTLWFNTPIESYVVVHATDFCGNQATDSTLVTVTELEVIVDAGADQIVNSCLTFVDLQGAAVGGYGEYTVIWTEHDSLFLGSNFDLNINPSDGSTYTITVTDECGNFDFDEVSVYYDIPEFTLQVNPDTLVCNGGIAHLWATAQGGVPPYQYDWSASSLNGPEINVQTYTTQNYTVMVSDQCGGFLLGETTVVVSHVNAVFDVFYEDVYTVDLNNRSTPGDYFWEFGDGYTSTETDPTHTYLDLVEYVISLEVTDSLGCQNTFSVVAVPQGQLYVPNAFTPNEDGVNDLLEVKGFNIASFDMSIVNRYGQEVFRTHSLEDKWNGEEPAGTHYSQVEVYIYSIKALTTRDKIIEKQGTITVIR